MRTTIGISLVLNALLAGGLLFLWTGRRPPPPPASATVAALPPPSPAVPPPVTVPLFHWSQLDSPDYHIYVRNLRAIGCPAGSLRAIVTADADAVYNQRRLCLEQKLSDISRGTSSSQPAGASSEPALRNELQHLPDQEASLIAELLGLPPASRPVAAVAPAPSINPPLTAANEPAALPLVLQEFDPATLNLSDDQQKTIASLRQTFLDQIGGPNQDPRDPAYLNRWQNAQLAADNMMQGMLGSDVYIKFQMLQMMAQNQADQQPPPN